MIFCDPFINDDSKQIDKQAITFKPAYDHQNIPILTIILWSNFQFF